jgi:hypothetical protein
MGRTAPPRPPATGAGSEPSPARRAAWVVASWTGWGAFVGAVAWLQGDQAAPWSVAWLALAFLVLGGLSAALGGRLPAPDRTVAGLVAGAGVGGVAGALAAGAWAASGTAIGSGAPAVLLFAAGGLASGLYGGLAMSLTGLMAAHLGLLETLRIVHAGSQKESGPGQGPA